MFEWGFSFGLYFMDSMMGSVYADKLLKAKTSRRTALFAWAFLYFVFECLIEERISTADSIHIILKVAADMVLLLLLLMILYQKDLSKQFFVAVSFIGGKKSLSMLQRLCLSA